jgi:arylsulfatase A
MKVDFPVCQTDYLATIAAIVGAKLPENAGEDSYSLFPAMKGKKYKKSSRGAVIHHSATGHFAIRDGKWKLNMFRGSGGSLEPSFFEPQEDQPRYELYNLEADPGETTNLYFEHPKVVNRLQRKITSIISKGRSTPGKAQDFVKTNWDQLTWMEL